MDFKTEFGALVTSAIADIGAQLSVDLEDLKTFAAERTAFLATIVDQVGYESALAAEIDNVCLRAGINAVQTADAADERIVGIIQGALRIGAAALA